MPLLGPVLSALPVELQERILLCVHGVDLVSAGRVCRLWRELVDGLCRRAVLSRVPADVQRQLRLELCLPADDGDGDGGDCGDGDGGDDDWTQLYRSWLQSQLSAPPAADRQRRSWSIRRTHMQPFTVNATFADGHVLYLADSEGVLTMLDFSPFSRSSSASPDKQRAPSGEELTVSPQCVYLHDGHINQIQMVWRWRLLVVTGQDTHFVRMSSSPHSPGDPLQPPVVLMCAENLSGQRRVSVHGDRLVMFRDIYQRSCLSLHRITGVERRWVQLEHLRNVVCSGPVYQWILHENQLVCLLCSGHISVWDGETDDWQTHAELYSEIKYENPAWLVRDTLFCSTITQRQMMGYWHLDRGLTYWLQGCISGPLVRVQPFCSELVLCLTWRRCLIAAGTQSGKVLLFCCGGSTVSLTQPVSVLELGFNAVESVALGFSDRVLHVFVKSKKTMVEYIEVSLQDWSGRVRDHVETDGAADGWPSSDPLARPGPENPPSAEWTTAEL